MINQFLQVGGVASLQDFYKKFPTQKHFDHYVQMKYGGGLNAYAGGGSNSSGSPILPGTLSAALKATMKEEQPTIGADGMTDYNRRPAEDTAAVAATPTVAKTKLNPYSGVSVVDFLGAQGKATDFANRKKLAEAMGIGNYTGKAGENTKLLKMLQDSPDLLDSYANGSAGGGASSGAKKKLPKKGGFPNADTPAAAQQPGAAQGKEDDDNKYIPYLFGAGAAGAAGYGAYKMFGKKGAAAMQELKALGYSEPAAMKMLGYDAGVSGGLAGGAQSKLLKNAPGIYSEAVNPIIKNITSRGSYTVQELKELMKTNPAEAQRLAAQFPKFEQATAKVAATVVPNASKVASAAAPNIAQQVVNVGKNANNAATTAEKVAEAAPGMFQGAGQFMKNIGSKAPKFLREAGTAAKEAGMVENAIQLYKWLSKARKLEDGGPVDDLEALHHHYKLNYLQDGGYMNNDMYGYGGYYQDGGEDLISAAMESPSGITSALKVLDPTGISSWGDAGRAIKNAYNNPGWGNFGSAVLETLGALPVVGAYGKEAKLSSEALKLERAARAAKIAKEGNIFQKAGNKIVNASRAVGNVGIPVPFVKEKKYVRPFKLVEQLDQASPISAFSMNLSNKAIANAPKSVKKVANFATGLNRFGRWDNAFAQPIINRLQNKQAYGGDAYANVPQHGNPGVYADGTSGTFNGGQGFQEGGSFVPSYGDSAYSLPQYSWGANYQEGGMPPEEMVSQGAPQQGPPQQPSEGGGIDPQQVMQEVAQMLQQGAQPEQIMQQLVQEGIPQDVAQQIIQQVMQQMQGGQYQQAAPQQSQMAYGGTYSKGGEYNMSHEQVQDLINKGYKIEYL